MKHATRAAVAATASLALMAMAPAAALAGERAGNGQPTPIHHHVASSECSFSGLEDQDLDHDGDFDAPVVPGVVSNWGVIPKAERDFLATLGYHPGNACNPNGQPPPPPD